YFAAVLALSVLGFIRQWPGTAKNLVYHVLFIHTFDETTLYGLIAPLWFIGVIVHWYLVLPLIGWVWLKLKHRLAVWVAATCVTTAIVHALALAFPSPPFALVAIVNKGLVGALPFLFAGMTAAAYFVRARQRAGASARELPIALVMPAALVVVAGLVLLRRVGSASIAPFAMAGVLLMCARASLGGRLLAPVRAFGRASYSAFIWHMPVIVIALKLGVLSMAAAPPARTALVLLVTLPPIVAVSFVSYRVLEKPFFALSPSAMRSVLRRLGLAATTAAASPPIAPDTRAQTADADTGLRSSAPRLTSTAPPRSRRVDAQNAGHATVGPPRP
ncbi:MAG TPA: acyltransferase, partial [Vicinamibacterales bacterium]|nr:acyltransferase [Vicinamibacterales bacterium]